MTWIQQLDAVRASLKGLKELRIDLEAYERKVQDYQDVLVTPLNEHYTVFRNRLRESLFWLNHIILDETFREQEILSHPVQEEKPATLQN